MRTLLYIEAIAASVYIGFFLRHWLTELKGTEPF